MYDELNTKNVAIVSTAITVTLLAGMALGIYGNNTASKSTARIAVACVTSGGEWVDATADCRR